MAEYQQLTMGITCQDGTYHGQRMLESEEEGQHDGHAVVEAEEWRGLVRLLHEGEIGAEQEGIVVAAEETIAGEEGPLDDVDAVADGEARGLFGHDLGGDLILIHDVVGGDVRDGTRGWECALWPPSRRARGGMEAAAPLNLNAPGIAAHPLAQPSISSR